MNLGINLLGAGNLGGFGTRNGLIRCCLLALYVALKAWKNDYQAADTTPRWESADGGLSLERRTLVEGKEGMVRFSDKLIAEVVGRMKAVSRTGQCKTTFIRMDG